MILRRYFIFEIHSPSTFVCYDKKNDIVGIFGRSVFNMARYSGWRNQKPIDNPKPQLFKWPVA